MASYDRLVKLPRYQGTRSIQDILYVAKDRIRVEHFSRQSGKWKSKAYAKRSASIVLPGLECSITVEDIYSNIDL